MRFNNIANKSIAIWTVFILVISVFFSINVSAELFQFDDDGVAYNEFENSKDITLVNCSLSPNNGSVILEYAPHDIIYDHLRYPDNVNAWYSENLLMTPSGSGGSLAQFLSRFIKPDFLNMEKFPDLEPIDKEDSQYLESKGTLNRVLYYTYYPIQLYEIEINENTRDVESFEVQWWPGPYDEDANLEEISMFLWSSGDLIPKWNEIGKLNYDEDISKYSIKSNVSSDKYIDEDGNVYTLIVGKPDPEISGKDEAFLATDYVRIKLYFKEGYNPEGYVISKKIEPTKFQGWESIIWESTKPTEDTYVKLQILDENEDVIESLEGNTEGFLNSPIDISSLDASYNVIKLKAILHSDKLDSTPYLYKWIILWQTIDGFFDSFNFLFRIKEGNGIKIDGGNIGVSEFYSEWPIFGKNPANTRSYVGKEIEYEGNKTYWQTYVDKDIAGWFRTPVMKDGRVYIGANDKKIYAFDLALDSEDDESEYEPVDESIANYLIETGVAVGDKYVIAATSELNSRNNKIYALNKSDLSEVVWEYPKNKNEGTICFSSSPTIANGRVYITSWSGKYAKNPMLSYVFDKLNSMLNYRLYKNKLIALDENSGNLVWDSTINLPAGSLSTPAFDNGIIYVGCDNIQGASLFAYNAYTGKKIWNKSVGSIGRTSPVIIDFEGKKILLVVARQQKLFSFNGTDKIYALDAEDGSILWNKTIGNQSSILRNIELKLYNFSNLKATSQPAATPAVFDDTVFVMASNGNLFALDLNTGKEKWTFNKGKSIQYNSASPIVIGDTVYMFTQDAHLYGLDIKTGDKIIDFKTLYDFQSFIGYLYASPIIADGLVLVSILEWTIRGYFYGHLMCFGEYKENTIGNVYSIPLHVQKGKWWNKFNAKCENTEENNSIYFNIIDEEGNKLITGLNGTNNDISSVKKNTIQICAEFDIKNTSEPYPLLNNWGINWSLEDKAPVFINSSFRAGDGQGGWINLDIEECSIDVKDYGVDGVISGIDVDTAKFTLEYISSSGDKVTKTFDAICEGDSGDNEEVKVIAKISELDIKFKEIKNITFKIKDLAGNEATSEKITFKIDAVKPISEIKDINSFEEIYTSEVLINAEGEDDNSGIANIALYYREVDTTIWMQYGSDESPYNWSFENYTSNYYEFCTIAKDNAGNKEDFPDEGKLSFLFDMKTPFKPVFEDTYYFKTLPKFSGDKEVTFEDDFEIDTIKYRLNFHGLDDWTTIKDGAGVKTYSKEWSISQDDWVVMIEDKKYYVFFKVIDIAGNEYETPSQFEALGIIKDENPPTADVYFDLDDFDGGWDDTFTVTAIISEGFDFEYVVLEYSYSSDDKEWSEYEKYGESIDESPFEWKFESTEGNGYYKFKTKLYNATGYYIESNTKKVNIATFPINLLLIMIALVVILFILSFYVIIKLKKKDKDIK